MADWSWVQELSPLIAVGGAICTALFVPYVTGTALRRDKVLRDRLLTYRTELDAQRKAGLEDRSLALVYQDTLHDLMALNLGLRRWEVRIDSILLLATLGILFSAGYSLNTLTVMYPQSWWIGLLAAMSVTPGVGLPARRLVADAKTRQLFKAYLRRGELFVPSLATAPPLGPRRLTSTDFAGTAVGMMAYVLGAAVHSAIANWLDDPAAAPTTSSLVQLGVATVSLVLAVVGARLARREREEDADLAFVRGADRDFWLLRGPAGPGVGEAVELESSSRVQSIIKWLPIVGGATAGAAWLLRKVL